MATRFGIGAGTARGIASGAQGIVAAPPTNMGNGSGGPGMLGGTVTAVGTSIGNDIDDLRAGRFTLGAVGLSVVVLIAFYMWTRSAQGGG